MFDIEILRGASISIELRIALELIVAEVSGGKARPGVRCVARPEVFTHGATLDWLVRRLEGVRDHFCLSDGTSVKLIPGLRNHLFTYGLHSQHRHTDFQKLMRRAPELLGQFHSQVNSFHRIASKELASEPMPWLMNLRSPLKEGVVWFFEFYLNPNSLVDSAERMLGWGDLNTPPLSRFDRVTWVPLTECAVHQPEFQRILATLIASAYFDKGACLLIQLPVGSAELTEKIRMALEGIRAGLSRLPQVRSTNIFFLSGHLPEEVLRELGARLKIVLHETFDFWRYTQITYRQAKGIDMVLSSDARSPSEAAKRLLGEAFGQAPHIVLPTRRVDVDGFPA